jgi:hypothetical protein
VLQLWEGWILHQGLPRSHVGQLTAYSSARGEPADGPSEGPSTTVWPRQLHHHGGEEVLAGTFFLNERPITILFDSGASHDFMSATCAKKAK